MKDNSTSYFFISDLHFGFFEYEKEKPLIQKFERLIDSIADSGGELFILGDLFDYWFEYKTVIQKNSYRIITKLEYLVEKGVKISYLIGNHDFAHLGFFSDHFGIKMYDEEIVRDLHQKRFFMAHGDGLVTNDSGYKALRSIVRNKSLQKIYSTIHPTFGIKLAKYFSKKSRYYTDNKNYGTIDGLFEFAHQKINSGFDFVILGHAHRRIFEKIDNGYYVNLGTWLNQPCYGIFDGDEFKIIDL